MGADDEPGVVLAKGLLALSAKAWGDARLYLQMTHPLIANLLVERVNGMESPGE